MINLKKEEATSAPIEEQIAEATVTVDTLFYNKLIDIAYNAFATAPSIDYIRNSLIRALESVDSTVKMVKVAKEFIEEREFVDKVISEKQRIEYNKL